jgi:hypothetical protein
MRATQCKRCKQPLYLPDGRMAHQVVDVALQHGQAYYQAGYDPLYAPGVVAAAPILAHRPQSELTWVTLVRTLIVLTAVQQFALIVVGLYIAQSTVHRAFGASIPGGLVLGVVAGALIGLGVVTTLLVWWSRYLPFRIIYAVSAVLLFVKYAGVPIFPLGVFNLVFAGIFAFALVMSLVAPSPNLPGGAKLDGPTAFLASILCLIAIGAYCALSVQAVNQYPKQLNQSRIISVS